MRVRIEKMGINGEGIGYINKKPVFVPGALVEEEVDIEVVQQFKTYAIGKMKRVAVFSKHRVKPKCYVQGRCQACSLMTADADAQLEYKRDLLKQSLIKYAQINPRLIEPMVGGEQSFGYRNQCKLPIVKNKETGVLESGMYIPNSNYFLPIEHCIIHEPDIESMRKQIMKVLNTYKLRTYDYHQKRGIRTLIIRGFEGAFQVTLVTGEDKLPESMIEELMALPGMVSLWQSIHTIKKTPDIFGKKMILLGGESRLPFVFDGLKLQVSPRSFFQLNTEQAKKLYHTILEMVKGPKDLIVEAYSGIGAISLYLKDQAKEIIGIESIKDAVVNAAQNAKMNQADNVRFICADAGEKLTYIAKKRKLDMVIVDPPRTGLDDVMLECLIRSKVKEIIYVSCNPATLGKNLDVLCNYYKVERIVPIDMFPNTQHVETVVLMSRKDK